MNIVGGGHCRDFLSSYLLRALLSSLIIPGISGHFRRSGPPPPAAFSSASMNIALIWPYRARSQDVTSHSFAARQRGHITFRQQVANRNFERPLDTLPPPNRPACAARARAMRRRQSMLLMGASRSPAWASNAVDDEPRRLPPRLLAFFGKRDSP